MLQANRALLALILLLGVWCAKGWAGLIRQQGRWYWLTPYLLIGKYGLAKQALLAPLAALLGSTARSLLWINVVLGSLTPIALGLATTLLTRRRLAGLLAALLLACLPAHIRLSASESGLVAYNFPDFLLLEHGKRWDVVRQKDLDRPQRPLRRPLILYHGLTCYSFTGHELSQGSRSAGRPAMIRPECHSFRQQHKLKVLSEQQHRTRRPALSPRHQAFHQVPAQILKFGFYLIEP